MSVRAGRYELRERIATGAMAEVYEAFDPTIGRRLACKILKEEFAADRDYAARFLAEARAAGQLQHAGIVTIFDVGELDGRPYIVMEYLDGLPLDEVIRKGPMSPLDVCELGSALGRALSYAHKADVVHRDVKPANVIVAPDRPMGEAGTVKLADFGIARLSSAITLQQTQAGMVIGTPQYMSPEQVMGRRVDARSDLFSLGAVLYEALTGKRAFSADSAPTLMFRIAKEPTVPVRARLAEAPVGLARIVERLLQKEPAHRFPSADDLVAALEREKRAIVEQEQVSRHGTSLRTRVTMLTAAVLALIMTAGVTYVQREQARELTELATREGRVLTSFIVREVARPLLLDDWIAVQTYVSEASTRGAFTYLTVADETGVIRAATDTALVNQTYAPAEGLAISDGDGVRIRQVSAGAGGALDFEASVNYASRATGTLRLGVDMTGFEALQKRAFWLLTILATSAVLGATAIAFVLAGFLVRPIRHLREGLDDLMKGRFDHRLTVSTAGELAEAAAAFNRLASRLDSERTEQSVESDRETDSKDDTSENGGAQAA